MMKVITFIFEFAIAFYCFGILTSYLVITLVSAREVRRYKAMRDRIDFSPVLASPMAPSLTVIAPAYNEAPTIVDNIRSLVSLHYGPLTVIVVNDGSKDDTLQRAIEAYDMEPVDYAYEARIDTKEVRGIYKSKNPGLRKLLLVDKHNGGKADAINTGVNLARSEYFACIDVDCIIDADAFLKMMRPVMMARDERIIAVGGIVWLTNNASIRKGKLISLDVPTDYVPRIQLLEYFRAFLLGRTAWSKINGMLLISGAFGIFDRKLVVEVGGYNHNTVGEDMELVMRMHTAMLLRKEKYRVVHLPDPLCWTEAPGAFKILKRQRNRWTRGTIECLLLHKKMLFNPRYGILGMLSYPYWLFAEWMAPMMEAGGLLFFLITALLGLVNWPFFWALLMMVFAFAFAISTISIFVQESTYYKYGAWKGLFRLFGAAYSEPFYYHPRTVWWSLKGNYDFITGKNKGWGEMVRTGFSQPQKD